MKSRSLGKTGFCFCGAEVSFALFWGFGQKPIFLSSVCTFTNSDNGEKKKKFCILIFF